MSYLRFAAMIATGTVVMYAVMYMATYQLDHITLSESRIYMALAMGATMAVIMLAYMWSMYSSRAGNIGILAVGVVVLAVAVSLDRSQALVKDVAFMRAMIPHHSMAITRSERARISDPRVRKLADQIIEAQREEIAEMKMLIEDLDDTR
ncbi:DUF305 domain-containing protein [Chelativorans alearense]|uniref:DUF305 domain-containing protein n=1 Tax=Chelativorans alearense TaxID=2681495 RepID=UPI0013D77161|nr:DUF305 domain-containing protein [Chelativorans alearense]